MKHHASGTIEQPLLVPLEYDSPMDEEEKQALKEIYSIYQNTTSDESIPCGCGQPAQIAYQGHISSCQHFQLIPDRQPIQGNPSRFENSQYR